MFVEDFLHGQGDDDFVAALEEGFDLLQRVRRIIERHEEAFLAVLAHHHGFKGVYVRAAGLVFLFHLDGIPAFFQAEFFKARRMFLPLLEERAGVRTVVQSKFLRPSDGKVVKDRMRVLIVLTLALT